MRLRPPQPAKNKYGGQSLESRPPYILRFQTLFLVYLHLSPVVANGHDVAGIRGEEHLGYI